MRTKRKTLKQRRIDYVQSLVDVKREGKKLGFNPIPQRRIDSMMRKAKS